MRRLLQLAGAAAALALGSPLAARAAEPAATGGTAQASPRIRASHRVDVIAPGEKVETVIDRLRAARTAAERRGGGAGPEGRREGGATGGEAGHTSGGGDRTGEPAERSGSGDRTGGGEHRGPGGSQAPGSGPPVQGDRPHR